MTDQGRRPTEHGQADKRPNSEVKGVSNNAEPD